MKKVLLLAIGMAFLVGCSSTGITVTNPVKIGTSTVQIPSMTQPIIDAIDAACTDVPFNTGAFDRLYKDRMNTLTIQQKADLDYFRAFCLKDKTARTPYEYGWIAGSIVDNVVGGIVPFLGRDALSALRTVGLL